MRLFRAVFATLLVALCLTAWTSSVKAQTSSDFVLTFPSTFTSGVPATVSVYVNTSNNGLWGDLPPTQVSVSILNWNADLSNTRFPDYDYMFSPNPLDRATLLPMIPSWQYATYSLTANAPVKATIIKNVIIQIELTFWDIDYLGPNVEAVMARREYLYDTRTVTILPRSHQ